MIQPLTESELGEFFAYLDAHLKENGVGGMPLFQPQPRDQNGFPARKHAVFRDGLGVSVGAGPWRRVWVYRDESGHIAGHLDLRGRPEPFTRHRALVGIGLAPGLRGKGIGLRLIEHVLGWAKASGVVEYVDLEVLANNAPARKLYERAGFVVVGRIDDLFRIDGKAEGQVMMTRKL